MVNRSGGAETVTFRLAKKRHAAACIREGGGEMRADILSLLLPPPQILVNAKIRPVG